jgi:hypothetical protein
MTFETPRKKHRLLRWLAIGVILGGAAAFALSALPGGAAQDYRDPLTLAHAIRDAKGGQAADCVLKSGDTFACAVGRADGSQGMYEVTVSPDGRSWTVTG